MNTPARMVLRTVLLCLVALPVAAEQREEPTSGYIIETPGTITFQVGVTIKGRVEKPQVMIFLPKERPLYHPVEMSRSFVDALMQPLPFEPLLD